MRLSLPIGPALFLFPVAAKHNLPTAGLNTQTCARQVSGSPDLVTGFTGIPCVSLACAIPLEARETSVGRNTLERDPRAGCSRYRSVWGRAQRGLYGAYCQ